MLAAGLIVSRFIHYGALLMLFGGALFPLYAGGQARSPQRRWLAWSAALALAGGVGWFEFTAASMADSLGGAIDPRVLASVVTATEFGPLWLGRLAVIGLVLVVVLVGRRPGWTAPALSALALASLAATGHAREPDGWGGMVHAAADAAHLIAAGVWLGALCPLGAALAEARRHASPDEAATGNMLARFSGVASVAVAAVLASGLVNSWYLVGAPQKLIGTGYGRLLLAKIALFVAMTLIAAANRLWITPRLAAPAMGETGPWLDRLRRHVIAEQALALLIVAVVSVLGTLEPAVSG